MPIESIKVIDTKGAVAPVKRFVRNSSPVGLLLPPVADQVRHVVRSDHIDFPFQQGILQLAVSSKHIHEMIVVDDHVAADTHLEFEIELVLRHIKFVVGTEPVEMTGVITLASVGEVLVLDAEVVGTAAFILQAISFVFPCGEYGRNAY